MREQVEIKITYINMGDYIKRKSKNQDIKIRKIEKNFKKFFGKIKIYVKISKSSKKHNTIYMCLATLKITIYSIFKNKSKNNFFKKSVDIWEGGCYYNQVAAIRQRQKLKETQQITEFFKN